MTKLKKTLKLLNNKVILAGDFNCTETDGIKDCIGGSRKDTFRESFRNFIDSCKLADAELHEDVEDVAMTHRNHSGSKGARLDRIYGDKEGLEEICLTPGYIKFLYGDHTIRTFKIGHPSGSMNPRRESQLSKSDLTILEVKELVHDLLKSQATDFLDVTNGESPDLNNVFKKYDEFKKTIRKRGCKLVSKLKHKEKTARAFLARKIAYWEDQASQRSLNLFENKELKDKQHQLIMLNCLEQEER